MDTAQRDVMTMLINQVESRGFVVGEEMIGSEVVGFRIKLR